jgi:hypothetical protein
LLGVITIIVGDDAAAECGYRRVVEFSQAAA